MKKLILASNSPRRREILTENGYVFSVVKSDYTESSFLTDPFSLVELFAKGKAEKAFDSLCDKNNAVVLGADTIVYFDGKILGKPKNKDDAFNTLKLLSGKKHKVVTGCCVVSNKNTTVGHSVTDVTFNRLSDRLIRFYVDSGLPLDKAGSYGIQDGYPLVEKITGSLNNVIGLPVEELKNILDAELFD